MPPLPTQLRNRLEAAVKQARRTAEAAAKVALERLTVGSAEPGTHLSVEERQLRNRLRAHGRQLGDQRDPKAGGQAINRLIHECAYEHWHRMLFARFLAENHLLIHEKEGMPVTLAECDELARDEVAQASGLPGTRTTQPLASQATGTVAPPSDGWTLAARYAARMLPQIFRPDDPVLQVGFAPEHKRALEKLVTELPVEVFTAEDSLGWVYQFWQAERKDEVNASGDKITGETLPAVTQLFTEHYMVLFLLHNTIGAWWADRVKAKGLRLKAEWDACQTEEDCRKLVALPGYEFTYLRFVREEPQKAGDSHKEAQEAQESEGRDTSAFSLQPSAFSWRPAAGAFPGWPKSLKDFKLLDPCCGSGHFLVAAFVLLVLMRMQDEKLSAKDACDAVLRENLHGLELDARCTQIAAFALALTAWKFPNLPAPQGGGDSHKEAQKAQKRKQADSFRSSVPFCGNSGPCEPLGFRRLPPLNIACSGLGVNARKEDWLALANGDTRLHSGLEQLYDLFQKAPELGSLINPRRLAQGDLVTAGFAEIQPLLTKVLQSERAKRNDDLNEIGVAAQGMAQAAHLLSGHYQLTITNVPYLARLKQSEFLQTFCDRCAPQSKTNLATVFVERCLDFSTVGGSISLVTPQNWLFLTSYKRLRERLLGAKRWDFTMRLGPNAFETISGEVVNVALLALTNEIPSQVSQVCGMDATPLATAEEKRQAILTAKLACAKQLALLKQPDARVNLGGTSASKLLADYADSLQGLSTGDNPRLIRNYWEFACDRHGWSMCQGTTAGCAIYGGRESVVWLEVIKQEMEELGAALRGTAAWGERGVSINRMGDFEVALYDGDLFDINVAVIHPHQKQHLPAVLAFCSTAEFRTEVRRLDPKMNVTNATFGKVPFDLTHWQRVAAEKYLNGMPEPDSNDPTQWLFNGRLAESTAPLQVGVARLLGYCWPRQTGQTVSAAPPVPDDGLENLVDEDGIVCIPSVRGEPPAAERLRALLAAAYEGGATVPVAGRTLACQSLGNSKPEACATFEEVLRQTTYFSPNEPIDITERNLPHWRQSNVTYFVTFRLADALPAEKLAELRTEREAWLELHPEPYSEADRQEYHRLFSQRLQDWLDAGMGSCLLREDRVAELVASALRHFDGVRYELGAWVVMPNHVHALVTPREDWSLDQILHSWKSFSSHEINKLLRRTGPVWQHEGYDHIVRNPRALWRIEQYIAENPRKAGLQTRFVHCRLPQKGGATVPVAGTPEGCTGPSAGKPEACTTFQQWLDRQLSAVDYAGANLEDWLRNGFFEQHSKLFHHRPFIWQIWDGRKDGFSALVNYHKLDHKLLEKLTYTYLGDWIKKQQEAVANEESGADDRLLKAQQLQDKLKLILEGEAPYDIFVRWKPLEQQPIGWHPDLNDGVRLNIRPFMEADVLRKRPKIKWGKDRGKNPPGSPWGEERDNDRHLTLAEKRKARMT